VKTLRKASAPAPAGRWRMGACSGLLALLLAVGLAWPGAASAAVALNRSRIIMSEQQAEVTPQVLNQGQHPVLLQIWIDEGQPQAKVEELRTPFVVDPPIFRLDGGQTRRLRVLLTQPPSTLPAARESVYWLNVLEIPARRSQLGRNQLSIGFRSRIKLFFRPNAVVEALRQGVAALQFTWGRNAAGQSLLHIHNSAPIHQSLNTLKLEQGQAHYALQTPMVGPGESCELILPAGVDSTAPARLHYSIIDDDGNPRTGEQAL
jgi:P pilus assembly chaperone PapD